MNDALSSRFIQCADCGYCRGFGFISFSRINKLLRFGDTALTFGADSFIPGRPLGIGAQLSD
jgi:hypothetical protein